MKNEIWKDIPGYEGRYRISTNGRILSLLSGTLRRDVAAGKGYRCIQLSDGKGQKHRHYVHRLVAATFIGPPPFPNAQVNHRNCNKEDNSVGNLEWVSAAENMQHAYLNGKIDFRRPLRCDNRTGHKGIHAHSGGYQVSFCGHYIGWFKTLNEAIIARKKAEEKYENRISIT